MPESASSLPTATVATPAGSPLAGGLSTTTPDPAPDATMPDTTAASAETPTLSPVPKTIRIMLRPLYGGGLLREVVAETLRDAVLQEVAASRPLSEADLRGADLRGADLRWADLSRADLSGAYLSGAYLSRADLRGADLRGADLRGADLRGADLRGADLRGADLRGADLRWALLAWGSHALLSHILTAAAGDDHSDPQALQRRMVAGLVAVSLGWCWDRLLALPVDAALRAWALDTLAARIVEGDDAPRQIRAWRDERAAEKAAEGAGEAVAPDA